jgi:pimeloyl-ACP methyl ester carboxylesterase
MPEVNVGDISMYYEVNGAGEPLVLLHGLGSTIRDWERQVPIFAQRYQVITGDMRGHGRSSKPPGPYSVPQFTADVVELLHQLQVESAHILGLSMGGMIAFQMAVDTPQLVKSMVIVNSGPELVPRTWREHLGIWQRLLISRLMGPQKMGEVISQRLFPEPHKTEMAQTMATRWAENDKAAYLAATKALIGWSVAEQLPHINCPTLVISADQDYTPVSAKEAYVKQMPQARLQVIQNSRHATPIDQAEEFNRAVLQFWADL